MSDDNTPTPPDALDYQAIARELYPDYGRHPWDSDKIWRETIRRFLTHPKAPAWLTQAGYKKQNTGFERFIKPTPKNLGGEVYKRGYVAGYMRSFRKADSIISDLDQQLAALQARLDEAENKQKERDEQWDVCVQNHRKEIAALTARNGELVKALNKGMEMIDRLSVLLGDSIPNDHLEDYPVRYELTQNEAIDFCEKVEALLRASGEAKGEGV